MSLHATAPLHSRIGAASLMILQFGTDSYNTIAHTFCFETGFWPVVVDPCQRNPRWTAVFPWGSARAMPFILTLPPQRRVADTEPGVDELMQDEAYLAQLAQSIAGIQPEAKKPEEKKPEDK